MLFLEGSPSQTTPGDRRVGNPRKQSDVSTLKSLTLKKDSLCCPLRISTKAIFLQIGKWILTAMVLKWEEQKRALNLFRQERNYERDSEAGYIKPVKFQEAPHSEMTLSQDERTRNDKADSKTASAHKGEVIEPNHISEEYTVLKSLSNIVPHDPIEKLPEDHRSMETNKNISSRGNQTRNERDGASYPHHFPWRWNSQGTSNN